MLISSPKLNILHFTLQTHWASSRHQYKIMEYQQTPNTYGTCSTQEGYIQTLNQANNKSSNLS